MSRGPLIGSVISKRCWIFLQNAKASRFGPATRYTTGSLRSSLDRPTRPPEAASHGLGNPLPLPQPKDPYHETTPAQPLQERLRHRLDGFCDFCGACTILSNPSDHDGGPV